MKTMKKMMTVLVVLAMLLSLACTSAYADNTTVTLTIDKAESGQTYKLYKLMDLDYKAGEPATFSYTVAEKWSNFFTSEAGSDYVTIDDDGYVTWTTNSDKTAKALAAEVKKTAIGADYTVTASEGTVTVAVAPGYYVIESSLGTMLTVGSVYETTNIALTEKNALPTISKSADHETAYIGEKIKYTVTVTAQEGALGYVVTDDMAGGKLTLTDDAVAVTSNKTIAAGDYTVSKADNKLTVTFEPEFLNTLVDDDTITITYYAKLNSEAVIAGEGNVNTAVLTTAGKTKTAPVTVKTYQIDVTKQDGSNADIKLPGAVFKLYRMSGTDTKEYLVLANEEYTWAAESETTFTTDGDGLVNISGLGNGTYYLEEIQAPAGYNLLKTPEEVTINGANKPVTVNNNRGVVLPGTGGMGTTLFYVFGGILMAGAAVLLVSRKRSAN